MTARIFDNPRAREWLGFTTLRRVCIAAAVVHFSLAGVSGYRAVVQVYSVSLDAPAVLAAGTTVTSQLVTSGRIMQDARIELIQGDKVEELVKKRIPSHSHWFYDPRPLSATVDATVPSDILTRFHHGPAKLQLIVEGRMQWLYLPPPKVATVAVELN